MFVDKKYQNLKKVVLLKKTFLSVTMKKHTKF